MFRFNFKTPFILQINDSRHLLLCAFFFFLPFNYALTFNVGFPLKISEVALFLLVLLEVYMFYRNKTFRLEIPEKPFILLAVFLLISILSFITNAFWTFDYQLTDFGYRFGNIPNSALKTIYVIVIIIAALISSSAFTRKPEVYIRYMIYGAILAASYTWYLFVFSLFELPIFYLIGMDDWPQHGLFSFGHFIRCGTFKEGNYMGLFLLITGIIAFYKKKYLSSLILFISIIPTVSSMALVGLIVFLFSFLTYHFYLKKRLILVLPVYFLLVASLFFMYQHKDLKFILYKFNIVATENDSSLVDAQNSRLERINLVSIAYSIGTENPLLGVGLANYGLHLPHYNKSEKYNQEKTHYIPNNIYAEVFAEVGIVGFIIFIAFLLLLLKKTAEKKSPILFSGFLVLLFYFFAFPTFSVLFVWVYFGLILSRKNETEISS